MSERQEPSSPSGGGAADDPTRVRPAAGAEWRDSTTPGIPAAGGPEPAGGYPAPPAGGATAVGTAAPGSSPGYAPDYAPDSAPDSAPGSAPRPVRRADLLAGLLLLLAGAAAAISLPLRWLAGDDLTGLDLVRRGFDDAEQGFGEVVRSGFWQPLTVVFGGGVLFLLGLLMFVRGRSHRFLGLLALLVALLATAAVLVPLIRAGFEMSRFDLGWWFALAVPALGLLGALKALLTRPRPARRTSRT